MKNKVKILLMLIGISVACCTNTFAVSKEDIIGYVNSQSVCGDVGLFNRYKTTFTRLLKQKSLTEAELNTIYSYLQNSVGILNSKGVCKISDLNKLTTAEKNSVYGSLTAGAGIITNAPMKELGEGTSANINNNNTQSDTSNNKEGTKVTINTQDGTMDIYENGILVDKVSMSSEKMTYTGVNLTHVLIVVACLLVFIFALILFLLLAKKHTAKTRFIKNMLVSIMICSSLVGVSITVFGNKIESLFAMVDLVSVKGNDEEIKVELDENKTINKYPSYGAKYATLKIPNVNIENDVYFGDSTDILSLGIGHSSWSHMPTEGDVIVYSGHNREDKLDGLKNINIKEKIIVETDYATCTYQVVKTEILKDTRIDKLTKVDDNETLILYTCYPFDTYVYTDERFVVYSVLKEIKWK